MSLDFAFESWQSSRWRWAWMLLRCDMEDGCDDPVTHIDERVQSTAWPESRKSLGFWDLNLIYTGS
jgi:hypothetical protein